MACLPELMDALREGWLLEESREDWGEVSCVRLTLDRTGPPWGQGPLHTLAAGGRRDAPSGGRSPWTEKLF